MRYYKVGNGFFNTLIDKIPFEAHVPGYQYCGPGTDLSTRLARGDPGINQLDRACKNHDIAYGNFSDDKNRSAADKILASEAWSRVKSRDAGISERSVALTVAAAMRTKLGLSKVGRGISKCIRKTKRKLTKKKKKNIKKCSFKKLMTCTKNSLKKIKAKNATEAIHYAIAAAKHAKKQNGGNIIHPRVISIPKTGGILPLLPIFAGLSALGTLTGGVAGVFKAIGAANDAKQNFKESTRHNRQLEAIAIGKSATGKGMYLKPYKSGYGLYLNPYPQPKNS